MHSVTVWGAVAVFLVIVVVLRRDAVLFSRLAGNVSTWMFVAVVQGGIGYLQYFNEVPAVLVAAHVAGATALWVVTVQFVLVVLEPIGRHEERVDGRDTRHELRMSSARPASA